MEQTKLLEMIGARKTWCVTGVAGFIGSHIAERLLALGQRVIGIDNFSTGKEENLSSLKGLEFFKKDICDPFDTELRGVDIVLHQAALGSVPRSIADPIASHTANVTGFINILNAARTSGVKRFVYASSSAVYGDAVELPKREDKIGTVLSPYAATKRIDEIYARVFADCYGMQNVGLRYFNVFGPRQDPKGAYAAVIPFWIDSLVSGQQCFINGDGSTSRDFCFVDNVVEANILAGLALKTSPVYNIACGGRITLVELYQMIARAVCGADYPPVQFRDFRDGDVLHSNADISRAEKELGYRVLVAAEEGLKRTVESFLKA